MMLKLLWLVQKLLQQLSDIVDLKAAKWDDSLRVEHLRHKLAMLSESVAILHGDYRVESDSNFLKKKKTSARSNRKLCGLHSQLVKNDRSSS